MDLLVQVQQEMSLVKSSALATPLKSSLEAVGAQVKLEAAGAGVLTPGAALPGCSVRTLLQDMGLQVSFCTVLPQDVPKRKICVTHFQ